MKPKKTAKTKSRHIKVLAKVTASSKKSVEDCSTVVILPEECNSKRKEIDPCKVSCQDQCKWACQSLCKFGCKVSEKAPPSPAAKKLKRKK